MSPNGAVELVSGVGAKGTSKMALSGGGGLEAAGATRLAGLLREAPPLLASIDTRHACGGLRVLGRHPNLGWGPLTRIAGAPTCVARLGKRLA